MQVGQKPEGGLGVSLAQPRLRLLPEQSLCPLLEAQRIQITGPSCN